MVYYTKIKYSWKTTTTAKIIRPPEKPSSPISHVGVQRVLMTAVKLRPLRAPRPQIPVGPRVLWEDVVRLKTQHAFPLWFLNHISVSDHLY